MNKIRGFEPVVDVQRVNFYKAIREDATRKTFINGEVRWLGDVQLPVRADARSAGYDFFSPIDLQLLPAQKTIVYTDVKAYMQEDEVLTLVPRSSMGIKKGLMLSNTVGIIDSSYYSNPGNDGNIGLALLNTSGKAINIKKGERIAQGIFSKYLTADSDVTLSENRIGGVGSSGE